MHKRFIKALTWNTSVTFLYKAILLLHQIMLYSIISKELYGIQSTIFAIIYLTIAMTNFGFDDTLLPFFSIFSQSKKSFLQLIHYGAIRIIGIITIAVIIYNSMLLLPHVSESIFFHCKHQLFCIILAIFVIESIKKTINSIAQLAFLNKEIAYAEFGMITTYVSAIWIMYGFGHSISLCTIFLSMLITVSIELIYLTSVLCKYYYQLPDSTTITPNIPSTILLQQSIYNYIHQVSKTIFSPNSMTILFAYVLGFQQAATIKFFTNIITLGYTFIYKTISTTSGAVLSHTHSTSTHLVQNVFSKISQIYFRFLLTMTITTICIVGCNYYTESITKITIIQITLFFIVGFLEQITLIYEKLFISQHKSAILATINCLELFTILTSIYFILHNININNYLTITVLIFVKLISLIFISFLAKKYWNIPTIHAYFFTPSQ